MTFQITTQPLRQHCQDATKPCPSGTTPTKLLSTSRDGELTWQVSCSRLSSLGVGVQIQVTSPLPNFIYPSRNATPETPGDIFYHCPNSPGPFTLTPVAPLSISCCTFSSERYFAHQCVISTSILLFPTTPHHFPEWIHAQFQYWDADRQPAGSTHLHCTAAYYFCFSFMKLKTCDCFSYSHLQSLTCFTPWQFSPP